MMLPQLSQTAYASKPHCPQFLSTNTRNNLLSTKPSPGLKEKKGLGKMASTYSYG